MDADSTARYERQLAWIMLAAFVLLFVPAWFARGPWHVDDLRYVEAARQMGEYGDWLVPRLNGDVYGEKPPGYSWAICLIHFLTGTSYLVSGRIVATLSALFTGLMLVHLGRVLFGQRTYGWLAAGFFWTFVFILDRGTRSLIDSFLLMWTTLGVLTMLRAALAENWRGRIGWIAATVGALGYGCVVKGPVALVIPVLGALALGFTWRGRRGISFSAIGIGALAGGGFTLLWLWLASLQVGDWYLQRLLIDQSADRTTAQAHHAEPAWFYLGVILPVALPWIVFLPGAVRAAWKMRNSPPARAALGAFAWALVILVFFSVISGKRSGYVLPLFAPLALGLAWGVARMQVLNDRWLKWPMAVMVRIGPVGGALLAVAALLLALIPGGALARIPGDAGELLRGIDAAGLGILIGGGVFAGLWGAMLLSLSRRPRTEAGVLLLMVPLIGIFHAALQLSVIPAMDAPRSAATFGQAVNRNWNRDEPLVVLGPQKDGIVTYYCDIQSVELVLEAPSEREPDKRVITDLTGPLWVVTLRKDWTDLPEDFRARFHESAAADFNSKEYVLLHRR
ncbi:MAG: phospholipid carrier-dependent glycosyltransferase [Planctomycetes bacterium]|nr:phospholipid carrier-dependent glycosyltransferase [Planctomycetota bacterium]